MITVRQVKHTATEHYRRVLRTLLTGGYYERSGSLQHRLAHTLEGGGWAAPNVWDIFVAYVDGRVAGYCVHIPKNNGVEFYVTPRYRRQGVATKLVSAVRKTTGLSVLCAQHGFDGSAEFFKSCLIFVENHEDVYELMRKLGGDDYNSLPADKFIPLYKKANRMLKNQLHHALRKQNATATS